MANGNISNWKQQNRVFAQQNYAYTYDDLQRITNTTDGTFHQTYSYKDALGNFNGIFRNNLVKTSSSWALQNIDDNAYFYQNPLSSKITSILDYTGSQLGYKANSGTYAYEMPTAILLTTLLISLQCFLIKKIYHLSSRRFKVVNRILFCIVNVNFYSKFVLIIRN